MELSRLENTWLRLKIVDVEPKKEIAKAIFYLSFFFGQAASAICKKI